MTNKDRHSDTWHSRFLGDPMWHKGEKTLKTHIPYSVSNLKSQMNHWKGKRPVCELTLDNYSNLADWPSVPVFSQSRPEACVLHAVTVQVLSSSTCGLGAVSWLKPMWKAGIKNHEDSLPSSRKQPNPFQPIHKFRVKQIFPTTSVCHFGFASLSALDWQHCIPSALQKARNKSHTNGLNAWDLSSCLKLSMWLSDLLAGEFKLWSILLNWA